jgi:hypothetical protein
VLVHLRGRDERIYKEGQVRNYEDDISQINTHLQELLRHGSRSWVKLLNREGKIKYVIPYWWKTENENEQHEE